ncbi:MAG: methyltransferase domain-containing protein [Balneolaceae bacterium]|nr:methyltransferase domain-containing protein [Balneolaceae bacterium]
MDITAEHTEAQSRDNKLENYYRLHSRIYDATRWSFLFGREELLNKLPDLPPQPNILEVGCGTGKNIQFLEYLFPDAHIYGMDLSLDMLAKAQQKVSDADQVTLIHAEYGDQGPELPDFDLILMSYSLTMTGDASEHIFQHIYEDLKPGGYVAVVDFNTSPFKWFRKWMSMNHVNLDGHLHPLLQKYYRPVNNEIKTAYLGLWTYFLFVGQRG